MIKSAVKKMRNTKGKSILINRLTNYTDLFFNPNITFYPELLTSIKWNKILVLTPHADDETLGCGGFLITAARGNKNIKVILYSDNRDSVKDIDVDKVIKMRSSEFEDAMKTLSIKNTQELKIASHNFTSTQELIEITLKSLIDFSPDVILIPSFIDNHEEHKILNVILAETLTKLKLEIDIMMFEVWTAFSPNLVLNISDVINDKINAIRCYRSQQESINYIDTITGLNRYRSITHFKGEGYCEGFVQLKSAEYIELVKSYL
jgi:LmbE family N-acetylglucosaminyl deacetylase